MEMTMAQTWELPDGTRTLDLAEHDRLWREFAEPFCVMMDAELSPFGASKQGIWFKRGSIKGGINLGDPRKEDWVSITTARTVMERESQWKTLVLALEGLIGSYGTD